MFLLPPKVESPEEETGYNSTAHWLAVNDDLYCSLIYQMFTLNPLLAKGCQHEQYLSEALNSSIQSYLRDACRVVNLKIFQLEIYSRSMSEDQVRAAQEQKDPSQINAGE